MTFRAATEIQLFEVTEVGGARLGTTADVDASTLALTAVANDDVLPFETVDTDAKVLAPPAVLEDRASLSSALSSANLSRVSIGNTSSTSSALVVLNVLPFKSPPAVSTVPDVLLFGFSSGALGSREVPLVALTSSALVVLKVRLFETVLAVSTVPVERPNDIHAEVTGFDIAINPVVPEDVDASTLVLTAVANDDVLPFTVPDVVLLGSITDVLVTLDVPFSGLISSALIVLDVLLLESVLAVSTVPDVVLLIFITDVLVTLDVPFSALISNAVVVLDALLLESVLAGSTVPDVVLLGFIDASFVTLEVPDDANASFATLDVPDDVYDPWQCLSALVTCYYLRLLKQRGGGKDKFS